MHNCAKLSALLYDTTSMVTLILYTMCRWKAMLHSKLFCFTKRNSHPQYGDVEVMTKVVYPIFLSISLYKCNTISGTLLNSLLELKLYIFILNKSHIFIFNKISMTYKPPVQRYFIICQSHLQRKITYQNYHQLMRSQCQSYWQATVSNCKLISININESIMVWLNSSLCCFHKTR